MKRPIIGYVGLSHLGICYLLAAASKNYYVYGFDKDKKKIDNIKKNITDIKEKNLKNYLIKYSKNITFSKTFQDLPKCDIIYISNDVKTDSNGKSKLHEINYYINCILKFGSQNSILVILSQITPGFTSQINWPKELLYYQVETLVFGDAIHRSAFPERIIVGSKISDKNRINKKYKLFLESFKCPIINMNYESAELCKIAINMFLISNVTTANELGNISEKIGADWYKIIDALKLDKRIGKYAYLNTGLGLSGGNLERDLTNSILLSKKNNLNFDVFQSYLKSSKNHQKWAIKIFGKFLKKLKKNSKIGILGLSYKENTGSIKNSPSIALIKKFKNRNIYCYDPQANLENQSLRVKKCDKMKDVIKKAEVLIIMNKWDEFNKITLKNLSSMNGKIIIDPFSLLKKLNLNNHGYNYFSKGNK